MALSFNNTGTCGNADRARLLIVEDDLAVVFALRSFFAVAGYDVDCAAGPAEALRLLDQRAYHAVITDLHLLPGQHSEGLRVTAHARDRNPRACIVIISASAAPGIDEEARRSGADIYRTKPVELRELTACLAQGLGDAAPRASDSVEGRARICGEDEG